MNITDKGDDCISGHTRSMWNLVYEVLIKFECPIVFKEFGPNAPQRVDYFLTFFVPKDHPRCQEVVDYLQQELADEEREGRYDEKLEAYMWGTIVTIHTYSGIDTHLDRASCKRLAEYGVQYLNEKMREHQAVERKVH